MLLLFIHKCLSHTLYSCSVCVCVSCFELLLGVRACACDGVCVSLFLWIYFFNQANILFTCVFNVSARSSFLCAILNSLDQYIVAFFCCRYLFSRFIFRPQFSPFFSFTLQIEIEREREGERKRILFKERAIKRWKIHSSVRITTPVQAIPRSSLKNERYSSLVVRVFFSLSGLNSVLQLSPVRAKERNEKKRNNSNKNKFVSLVSGLYRIRLPVWHVKSHINEIISQKPNTLTFYLCVSGWESSLNT